MMAIMKRYPNAMRGEMLDSLGDMLTEKAWLDHQQLQFTELGLWFWPKLDSRVRFAFVDNLVDSMLNGSRQIALLERVRGSQIALLACGKLPRTESIRPYCATSPF